MKSDGDSGAGVNTIQNKFVRKEQVCNCSKTLCMFNKSILTPLGETKLTLKSIRTGEENKVKFAVVSKSFQSLLGLETFQHFR